MPAPTQAWVTPVLLDLKNYLVGVQVDAINLTALDVAQTDRFTRANVSVVNRIRQKVANNPDNVLSATLTAIPPELVWVWGYLVMAEIQPGLSGLDFTDDQRKQIERAFRELENYARVGGQLTSVPTDPVSEGGAAWGSCPRRRFPM